MSTWWCPKFGPINGSEISPPSRSNGACLAITLWIRLVMHPGTLTFPLSTSSRRRFCRDSKPNKKNSRRCTTITWHSMRPPVACDIMTCSLAPLCRGMQWTIWGRAQPQASSSGRTQDDSATCMLRYHSPLARCSAHVRGDLVSHRVWHWANTLQWYSSSASDPGVTTLELFCNFVVVTVSLPPVQVTAATGTPKYVEASHPTARLRPVALRSWLQAITAAAKQLARKASVVLFPPTGSRKVASLLSMPGGTVRSGFLSSCRFTRVEETALLLEAYLKYQTAEPFWTHYWKHLGDQLAVPHEFVDGVAYARRPQ